MQLKFEKKNLNFRDWLTTNSFINTLRNDNCKAFNENLNSSSKISDVIIRKTKNWRMCRQGLISMQKG